MSEAAGPEPAARWPSLRRALTVALVTTMVVTAISHALPGELVLLRTGGLDITLDANTLVGATFLLATWWTVLRGPASHIAGYGLALGGLTEPEALSGRRIAREALVALGWALGLALLFFPPFWMGYRLFWNVDAGFAFSLPDGIFNRVMGQLLVIALPEEAFFRGYLQSALDAAWPARRVRVLGAELGPGLLIASLIFAVGHMLTIPHPFRLAVFFPALLFGWLRARTGGIGASVVFHACCNLFSAYLAQGYGR